MVDDIDAVEFNALPRSRDASRFPLAQGIGLVDGGLFEAVVRTSGGNMQLKPVSRLPQPVMMNAGAARSGYSMRFDRDRLARRELAGQIGMAQSPPVDDHAACYKSFDFSADARTALW